MLLYLHVQCAVLGMLFVQYIKRNVFTVRVQTAFTKNIEEVLWFMCYFAVEPVKTQQKYLFLGYIWRKMEHITEEL